jgi:hypothetical protein
MPLLERDYTKMIPCPAHPNGRVHWWSLSRHKAILFCWPGQFAGIWECPRTGESDAHEHLDYEIEEVTQDHMGFQGHYQTESEVYVCAGPEGCGVTIEDADPAMDRADNEADRAYDEMRDREMELQS